ncbi:MAG: hypothetical protein AAF581_11675 [Planctomycetota bacterium]
MFGHTGTKNATLAATLLTALFFGTVATLSGCAGTSENHIAPTAGDGSIDNPRTVARTVHNKPRFYQRIFEVRPGGAETDVHVGYVGETESSSQSVVHIVYDARFSPVGFYLDNGATFVYDPGTTKPRQIGNHSAQRSLQLIYEADGPFRFAKFDARVDATMN